MNHQIQYRRDLHKLFEHVPENELNGAVEIGVAEGNFSEDILNMPVKFPTVWLVDRWVSMPNVKGDSAMPQSWHDANHANVVERTKKFNGRAVIIRQESTIAADLFRDNQLDLIYIDADHSYAGCRADINAWWPKLKQGGYMAFHDYQNKAYGVNKAVNEFANSRGLAVYDLTEDKPEDAGALIRKC